eukprot:892182-Rhodomonas_salina.2
MLRAAYAKSGTEIVYAPIAAYAMSGTDIAYGRVEFDQRLPWAGPAVDSRSGVLGSVQVSSGGYCESYKSSSTEWLYGAAGKGDRRVDGAQLRLAQAQGPHEVQRVRYSFPDQYTLPSTLCLVACMQYTLSGSSVQRVRYSLPGQYTSQYS